MARRPTPPASPVNTIRFLQNPTIEMQRALARIADYPQRVERLKRLWTDLYSPSYSSKSLRPRSRSERLSDSSWFARENWSDGCGYSARSRSSTRFAHIGATTMGSRVPAGRTGYIAAARSRGSRCGGDRNQKRTRNFQRPPQQYSFAGGPLTAQQIRDLMSRDLTPEDYELLLLLDEGVKKARTLSSSAAATLPRATGTAWFGEECRICLCALEDGEDVVSLPSCGHLFHGPCAERWLGSAKATCPLCGNEIME